MYKHSNINKKVYQSLPQLSPLRKRGDQLPLDTNHHGHNNTSNSVSRMNLTTKVTTENTYSTPKAAAEEPRNRRNYSLIEQAIDAQVSSVIKEKRLIRPPLAKARKSLFMVEQKEDTGTSPKKNENAPRR